MKKTILCVLLMVACCMPFVSAQTNAADTISYTHFAYMKVNPGMYDEYIKLEKAWKKIHLANKKAGKLDDWSLAMMISPSGADAEYNFVARNRYRGTAALAAMYEGNFMPDNWKSLLTPDEIALVERTEEIRTMVKSEVWTVEPQSLLWAADAETKARVIVFNYFSLPEDKSPGDFAQMQKDIWKPVHAARLKDGLMKGWLVQHLVLPLPYAQTSTYKCVTIDAFTNLTQLLQPGLSDYFSKVHAGKSMDELWKKTVENGTLEKAEVRLVIDRLSW